MKLLVLISLFFSASVLAVPVPEGYPDLKHLGLMPSQDRAVWELFNGEAEDIQELEKGKLEGMEYDSIFIVIHNDQKWFVKTVKVELDEEELDEEELDEEELDEVELDEEPSMYYKYEWELKRQKERYASLSRAKGEIVFPDKGAFFFYRGGEYYIVSYPFVPGQRLDFYIKQYVGSKKHTDKVEYHKVIYRYAQVAALLLFDAERLPEPGEDLLLRPIQTYLGDRGGANELYDAASDTVYLIDFAIGEKGYLNLKKITVKNSLMSYLEFVLGYFYYAGYGKNYRYFQEVVNIFIGGFSSVLPGYGDSLLRRMIWEYLHDDLVKECNSNKNEQKEMYCGLSEITEDELEDLLP